MRHYLIIVFIFIIQSLSAATYYVAPTTATPAGNNTNSGSLNSPFETINYGISKLKAGDILYVRSGTYVEAKISIGSINGTESEPIKIMAFPGESPIIDGQDIYPTSDPLIMIWPTASYVYFSGFEIKNLSQGAYISNGSHNLISNCKIHDIKGSAIGIAGDYCTVEDIETYNVVMANYNHGVEYWGSGISARRSPNYTTIRRCIVHDCWGEGISTFEATHTTIEDNIIYDVYAAMLYVSDATDCLVQRNLVYTTKDMYDGSQVGMAIWDEKNTPSSARNTYINNIVYGCRRNCYADQLDDVVIANNTFVNSIYSTCVQISNTHSNTIIENNIIIQEDGLQCISYNGIGGITFSHNLFNKTYNSYATGTGDVVGDPKFAKTGVTVAGKLSSEYFKILSTSPAINKGTLLSKVSEDFFKQDRGSEPDIGAHEYVAQDPAVEPTLADVATYKPRWITTTTATTGGLIGDDGGADITARGVCWNTTGSPTTADSKTEDGTGDGAFTSTMTGLTYGTVYYVRAYGTNSAGTSYGLEMTFRTSIIMHGGKIIKHLGKVMVIN